MKFLEKLKNYKVLLFSLLFMMAHSASAAGLDVTQAGTDAKTAIDSVTTITGTIFGAVIALLLAFIGFKYLRRVLARA